MVKPVLKIVVSIKSYRQKTDLYFVFSDKGHRKKPIFLKIHVLAQWALSRILAKIEKNKIGPMTK